MYYKSRELMAFVDDLRVRDPDALIVAFGDHLPFLGGGFRGYVEAETLAEARDKFSPEMFLTYVATPLIVIDGRRGPLDMGTIPLYQLPGEIIRLLGISEPTILDYAGTMKDRDVRPLWGMHFMVDEQGSGACLQGCGKYGGMCRIDKVAGKHSDRGSRYFPGEAICPVLPWRRICPWRCQSKHPEKSHCANHQGT